MAISINPVLPVLAAPEAGGVAPELVLQPGSVVNAQVLKVLSADLVRIAIASLSIDVASEIPLQQGQNLQLAVMQTKDGIRLAVVGQGGDAAGTAADAVTLSPDALADAAVNRPAILSPKNVLTPLERVAVSAAAQAAVTEQDSLAPLFANLGVQEILLPQARLPAAENLALAGQAAARNPLAAALDAEPSAGATLNLLQEALQELGNPVRVAATPKDVRGADVAFHTNTPPPPVRGALPTAQPIASPTIAPHAPLEATAHHLLDDTDAAIARQTLLQVASLPDRIDTSAPKADMNVPRWNFEIPFATPQGTAMAQFEISRDGGGEGVEATKRVWRARFSLDVEPAGPVHALISLNGEKTSVRIWAERPATAEQLRAGASQLSQALSRAELQPGDIVIRDGTPPQPAPAARAGHFLDRAL